MGKVTGKSEFSRFLCDYKPDAGSRNSDICHRCSHAYYYHYSGVCHACEMLLFVSDHVVLGPDDILAVRLPLNMGEQSMERARDFSRGIYERTGKRVEFIPGEQFAKLTRAKGNMTIPEASYPDPDAD